jgi:hypothetical protein
MEANRKCCKTTQDAGLLLRLISRNLLRTEDQMFYHEALRMGFLITDNVQYLSCIYSRVQVKGKTLCTYVIECTVILALQ